MSLDLKPLAEQTIVITGASSGIGLATARLAAKRGARVVLAARDADALAQICAELEAEGAEAVFAQADVSDETQIQTIVDKAISSFGGFDTWVNNAGIGVISLVEETSTADHRRIFDVNYFGLVYGSLAAVRHFRDHGKTGVLVNVGSAVGDIPEMLSVPYSASKHAIKGFTNGLRLELMKEGLPVSVTLIKPSGIDSPFFDHAKTNMGGMGKAPGVNYAPRVVAEAILHAATHQKRSMAVGHTATFGGRIAAIVPGLVERQQSSWSYDMLVDYGHMPEDDNLYHAPAEGRERSRYGSGQEWSLTTAAQSHPLLSMSAAVVAVGALAFAITSSVRR